MVRKIGLRGLLFLIALLPSALLGELKVCATTSIVADLAKQIGGEDVEVVTLMGAGVDPHLYKAKASDIRKLMQADVILYNGLHLEGRMGEVLANLKKRKYPVFGVAESLDEKVLIVLDEQGTIDPHVWFDPLLWGKCGVALSEFLGCQDPAQAEAYAHRGQAYLKKMDALKDWGLKKVTEIDRSARILITSHDAYNYFGRAFNFQVIGVQGVSTVSEAGLTDIVSTVDFIKEYGVKAIFVETSVSEAAIQRISEDSGAKVGGKLYSDALGSEPGTETLAGTLRYNINTIVEGLK